MALAHIPPDTHGYAVVSAVKSGLAAGAAGATAHSPPFALPRFRGPRIVISGGMINPATFIARWPFVRPMREEDALAALETLGLTGKEAKAYLELVRNGVSTAAHVAGLLGVQYPAVYRVLHSLQAKGWIEVSRERPNRYRARNPRVVAEQARQGREQELGAAAERAGALVDEYETKARATDTDLFLYKGLEGVMNKLREVVLSAAGEILVVSPLPQDLEVLRPLFGILHRARPRSRVIMNAANAPEVARLGELARDPVRVQLKFPASHLPDTRLAHTFVFPSDKELFIVNAFYRRGTFVPERIQGLWIGDADYVRLQLEAMARGPAPLRRPAARAFPKG